MTTPKRMLSDTEALLAAEALRVAATDADHYSEYGGDPDSIPAYLQLANALDPDHQAAVPE